MSLLNNLNESQREAGKTINGPLLILAGAGSGKTRTITYRIAHMVQEMGISPYHILAVTFTNKAAKEMRERVHNLIGHEAEKIVVSTFHSFGMKMLRMYANFLGYESNFNIYDTDDQTKVVRNILKELGATVQETPKKIVSLISKLKEDGVSPEDYEKTVPSFLENYKVIIETYKKYKIELKKNNAMDFSDLLIFTNELLDNPDLLIAAATKLKEERKARLEAENKVKVLEPKGQFYDDVAGSKDSIEMGHVAKVLGIRKMGRNRLFSLLRDKKILDKNNIPYQQYVDLGYFRILEQKYSVPNGEIKINIKTMVFQKGIDFIMRKIREE